MKPLCTEAELALFKKNVTSIDRNDPRFSNYEEYEHEVSIVRNAFFALVKRLLQDRVSDFVDLLSIIVGSRAVVVPNLWEFMKHIDNQDIRLSCQKFSKPVFLRETHSFLVGMKHSFRSWEVTAFVKFLRGNDVSGGKAKEREGFGYFNKETGWKEDEVKRVSEILYSGQSMLSKFFMCYDEKIRDRVYEELTHGENSDIAYGTQFSATNKIIDPEFIDLLLAELETRELAPLSVPEKKIPKVHTPKQFKDGDVIKEYSIRDLPPMSIVEIKVLKRLKPKESNFKSTIMIVLTETPKPGFATQLWRVIDGKAYLPANEIFSHYECKREALIDAVFKGIWDRGVEAHVKPYQYPYDFIGLDR